MSSKKRRTAETFEKVLSNIENEYGESKPTTDKVNLLDLMH